MPPPTMMIFRESTARRYNHLMSPTAARVRIAVRADAPAIVSLINAAFRVEKFFIESDRTNLQEAESFFEKGEFLLAEIDGKLAACLYLEPRGERTYLGLLSVDA